MIKYVSSLVFAALFLFTGTAEAATLYTQGQGGSSAVPSNASLVGADSDVYTYASFTPTQSGTVDNISWQGSSNVLYPGYADGFTVEVLANQPVTPDTVLSNTVLTKVVATGTLGAANATLAANGAYDYNLDVTPFAMQAGVQYYLSIRSNGIAPWGWTSAPGAGAISYYRGLNMWLRANGIPSFSLNNVHGSVVTPPVVVPPVTTIVPVPTPTPTTIVGALGEVQGMITSVGAGYVTINNAIVTYDGDTVQTFNSGLNALAVGEMVNYSYIVDNNGVIIAKTMDIYPAQAVTGIARVSSLGVNNATGGVTLSLYNGGTVEYFQPYAFITGVGTNTSFGSQLVNYVGFVNPTNGHIIATSGYMSNIPVLFKGILPNATVGQSYNQYAIDNSPFGGANIFSVGAVGLPDGLTNNMGSISGIPTTPGTYQVVLTAIGGQYNVAPYQVIGHATTTIVVDPAPVNVPPVTPVTFVTTLPGAQATIAYPATNLLATGVAPFTVTAAPVPAGMTVSAAGVLSGTPTVAGTFTINLTATDAAGTYNVGTVTVNVAAAPTPSVGTTLPNGKVGVVYGATSLAAPGVSLYMVSNGSVTGVPAGMTVSASGILSGTPTVAGTYQIGFSAIGSGFKLLGNATSTIVIDPAIIAPADKTAPVITMNGGDVILTVGDAYADAGATCVDNIDATCIVATTSTVNTGIVGTYTVTYRATDAAGNVATPVVRTVTVNPVPDTTAPTITMNGTDVTLTVGDTYVDAGATCVDNVDATCSVVTTNTVNTTIVGTYTVTYNATDIAGNIATPAVRTVTVNPVPDTTAPVITMNGTDVTLIAGNTYTDAGATCVDNVDATCAVVATSNVNTAVVGSYTVTYTATDAAGNIATPVARTVTVNPVPDTVAPTITMNGGNVTLTVGTSYIDAGATCTDNVDPVCTVVSTSNVITSTAGTYTVTYRATDAAGNVATPIVRTVTVNPAPVVTPPTTTYTSTGKTVESKGTIASYDATASVMTLTNSVVLRFAPTTKVKLNDGAKLSSVGVKVQYKGIKNTDASVTLTSIEIN